MSEKYTFIHETHYEDYPKVKTVVQIEAENVNDLVAQFQRFLLAAGFVIKGTLEIVEEE